MITGLCTWYGSWKGHSSAPGEPAEELLRRPSAVDDVEEGSRHQLQAVLVGDGAVVVDAGENLRGAPSASLFHRYLFGASIK